MEPDEADMQAATSAIRDGIERAKELVREASVALLDHCGQDVVTEPVGAGPTG